jgi:CHAT domain-containing protein
MGEGVHGPFPLGVKYLADNFSASYAQSATTLVMRRAKQSVGGGNDSALLICDPIFSSSDPRAEKVMIPETLKEGEKDMELKKMGAISDWGAMGVAGLKDKSKTGIFHGEELFPRLEKTRQLVETAGSLFGSENITALCGADASEQRIMGTDMKGFSFVIFATHGILDNTVPWIKEPALVLTQVGNNPPYDGFLTMSEIMNMKIPARLVLLLACRTGVGENVSGEGVMGLGRAFQYAGCSNTVMSLWSVNEDATVVLAAEMLKNVNNGVEPKLALKMAKDKMRRDGWEHPFYWSAFVIY